MLSSTVTAARPAADPQPAPALPARPDPEVPAAPARARRRQFTAAYKLRIVREADHCAIGHLGALLRREGLYSSHLADWRRQRAQGALTALAPQRRGRPVTPAAEREVARLRAENERLERKLAAAETVIEVQKKVAALLGLTMLPASGDSEEAAARRTRRTSDPVATPPRARSRSRLPAQKS